MVQFKPYFMGQMEPPHPRLTSVQKCFRTTDIESVGDPSHLTFFEMLGNFSIGDYFKREAVFWAWEYVTKVLGLHKDRLWAAVYTDDEEAYGLWCEVGIPPNRIRRYGEEHNFWYSGPVGPCGPCSEIHYDFGPQWGCGPQCEPSHDCPRFLEIWNLVFMTFFRHEDGSLTPLPRRNIDTGAGLERLASATLFQDPRWDPSQLPTVYDTQLFRPIIGCIEELSGHRYGRDPLVDRAMRIVAEHGRAVTFLIGDELAPVVPSNEERGYVVRRILRRAVFMGHRYLGLEEPFMADVAEAVINLMGNTYEELKRQRPFILPTVRQEEERFRQTLRRGLAMLEERLRELPAGAQLAAEEAFTLHDTYGFPLDLTREIANERSIQVDEEGFQRLMEQQRQRARLSSPTSVAISRPLQVHESAALWLEETPFLGYDTLEVQASIVAVLADETVRSELREGEEGIIVLSRTPFYSEGGGQVGDRGRISSLDGPGSFVVEDTQATEEGIFALEGGGWARVRGRVILHRGRMAKGTLRQGEAVLAQVDPQHREDTMRNHTATHLLQAALRHVLGLHVRQAGSLVAPDRLRFDFTHPQALTPAELEEVEALVNEKIRQNLPVDVRYTSLDEALKEGALAFFGEKYGEQVRVVEVNSVQPKFSVELCGGTHCRRTGDIGLFVIVDEGSVAAGVRRIEALTGRKALAFVRQQLNAIERVSARLGTSQESLDQRIEAILEEQEALRRKIRELERALATTSSSTLLAGLTQVSGVPFLARRVDAPSMDALRHLGDTVRSQLGSGVAVLGAIIDGRPAFLAIVTKDLTSKVHAGELVKRVAAVAGGSGGGRPDLGQGGGRDAQKLDEALSQAQHVLEEMLATR